MRCPICNAQTDVKDSRLRKGTNSVIRKRKCFNDHIFKTEEEEWLLNGAVVPVDVETTSALVAEIHRLIDVVGGMALAQPEQPAQRTWVGLADEERDAITDKVIGFNSCCGWEDDYAKTIEAKLKEKNT